MPGPLLPAAATRAIDALGLRVGQVLEVAESYASIVRILRLSSGEEVVLKLPWTEVKQRREIAALRALCDWELVPRVLDECVLDDGTAVMLLSRLRGEVIGHASRLDESLAAEVGAALARVHSGRLPHVGGEPGDAWWRALRVSFASCVDLCREHAVHSEIERAAQIGFGILDGPAPVAEPHLTHFDFRLGNLLCENGRLTGVLDFESARSGSGGMDYPKLAREVWEPRPELRRPMLSAYESVRPLPEPVDHALRVYDLYHAVAGMAWCVRRERVDDPFMEFNRAGLTSALSRFARDQPSR